MIRLAIAFGIVAVLAPAAAANPADIYGYGARGVAMGGAQTGASNDSSANYYNPALLAGLEHLEIDVGYQMAFPTLTVNDDDTNVDPSRGLAMSLTAPGEVGGLAVALGGSVFLPDSQLTRTRTLSAQQPRFIVYDNRPQRLFLSANLAIALNDRWFIGGGMSYMSSTKGDVLLVGRVGFPNADDSDLQLGMDVDLLAVRYGQASVLFKANDWLDIGVTARSGFTLELNQGFRIVGDVGIEDMEPIVEDGLLALRSISQDHFQPAQINAGFAAELGSSWLLAFDVSFHRWSTFDNPAANIELELDVGTFNDLIDLEEFPPLPDPNFHDILIPRLGLEWTSGALAVRGGYISEPSPAPEQPGDKHTVSTGAGYTLDHIGEIFQSPVSFDAYLALTMLEDRVYSKLSPADPVGDYRSGGHIWQAGIGSRWRF
jgi:hypothetical protein